MDGWAIAVHLSFHPIVLLVSYSVLASEHEISQEVTSPEKWVDGKKSMCTPTKLGNLMEVKACVPPTRPGNFSEVD